MQSCCTLCCRRCILNYCERAGVSYPICLAHNPVLERITERLKLAMKVRFAQTGLKPHANQQGHGGVAQSVVATSPERNLPRSKVPVNRSHRRWWASDQSGTLSLPDFSTVSTLRCVPRMCSFSRAQAVWVSRRSTVSMIFLCSVDLRRGSLRLRAE